jgi:hypothetical protein
LAQATPEEKAAAEAVFQAGMRLIAQGNFADACPKFEMSQRVEPAVGTMLYLGECYEKTNRTASSWAMFREAASLAEVSGQVERMKTAQARAARLEPRLAWLNIEISKDAMVPGLQLRRNGVVVATDLAGTPTPVDPGEIALEASAPGHVSFSTKVTVAPKGHAVVTVPVLAAAPESAAPAAAAPPTTTQDRDLPRSNAAYRAPPPPTPAPVPSPLEAARKQSPPVLPWVVGGVGVVGLGLGSFFGLRAVSKADEARRLCPDGLCNEAKGDTLAHDARTAATASNVSFALGATAVAAGVVLYFMLPTSKRETRVGLGPIAGQSSLGLTLQGRLAL